MRPGLLLCLLIAGCQTTEGAGATPSAAPAPVVAQLRGFGEWRANSCTVHFAAQAAGDVDTFSATRCNTITPECGVRKGRLTAAALEQVRALASRLDQEELETTYGCPGCADGPIAVLALHRADGRETKHTFDPNSADGLPAALQDASKLINALTGALDTCETTPLMVPEADCKAQLEKDSRTKVGIP